MRIPRVREWREARALTQKELAVKAGVSSRSVASYEAGGSARLPMVRRIADALEIEVTDLMGEEALPKAHRQDSETAPGTWPPRLGDEEAAAQARSGTGRAKLELWRDYVELFNSDRRDELKTGRVRRAEGWTLRQGERKPTWQHAEEIKLDNAATREAWELVVRRERSRILDELERFGVHTIASLLLKMKPEELSGEARENYRQAAGLSAAVWEMDALVASLSDELAHLDDEIERRSDEQDGPDEAEEILHLGPLREMPQTA
jgi:transcriptional regulator with XRE-family HTH domain